MGLDDITRPIVPSWLNSESRIGRHGSWLEGSCRQQMMEGYRMWLSQGKDVAAATPGARKAWLSY